MSADEDRASLPEVEATPLVVDVEFIEVEEERGLPRLDAVDEILLGRQRAYGAGVGWRAVEAARAHAAPADVP